METVKKQAVYNSSPERELVKMWEDIKGNKVDSLNQSLLKIISFEEHNEKDQPEDFTKQMWDSEKGGWVPFSLWGANFIINERKEYVVARMYRPASNQPQYGPTLKGWHSVDTSVLNEKLKEKDEVSQKNPYTFEYCGKKSFYEMVKQDRQEYANEGRHNELSGHTNGRVL